MESMAISRTALDVEWQRLQVIASNLANANTTRTADGGVRWQTIGRLPEGRAAMSFPAVDNGWVVGPAGYIVHYHLVPVPVAAK